LHSAIQNRLNRLKRSLTRENLDAVVVLVEENRRYLSSFTGEDTQFDESAGALIITGADLILATDSRYVLQAKRESPQYEIVTYKEGLAKALPPILSSIVRS
jgi:Xaa-Pro aminopeptidase